MKTLVKSWLLVFCLAIVGACNKTDLFTFDSSGDLNNSTKKGKVFMVSPNGTDDTQNIITAFENAKAAGPESTVELTEGNFTIGMIEVREFNGNFKGAGQGKTIITNRPGLPCEECFEQNICPSLMKFIGGKIKISDMTFHIADGNPCAYGPINASRYADLLSVVLLSDYSTIFMPDHKYINGTIDHVDFIAGNDGGGQGWYGIPGNVTFGVFCAPDWWDIYEGCTPTTGDIAITNCYFESNLTGIDVAFTDEKSTVKIENNVVDGTYTSGYWNIFAGGMIETDVTIKNNISRNCMYQDICVIQDDFGFWPEFVPTKSGKNIIVGNTCESLPGVTGLYLSDGYLLDNPGVAVPQSFEVKNNIFTTSEGGSAIISQYLTNAKFTNNTFLGTGIYGIWIDGDQPTNTFAEKNHFINNDFSGAAYDEASVYLGPYTKECLVVGVPEDDVIDLGINNTIRGPGIVKTGTASGFAKYNNVGPMRGKFQNKSMK